MDIKEIKKYELMEIRDFLDGIEEYGHIYHYPPEKLDEPFRKILEGIAEVHKLMDDSFEM
jgi:hypothetical protein